GPAARPPWAGPRAARPASTARLRLRRASYLRSASRNSLLLASGPARSRRSALWFQGEHLFEAEAQALGEQVAVRDRRAVRVEAQAADARVGEQGRHHGAAGQRAEREDALDPRPGIEDVVGQAGHVAGLQVDPG